MTKDTSTAIEKQIDSILTGQGMEMYHPKIMIKLTALIAERESQVKQSLIQEIREKVQDAYTCIGPNDEIHRCSYGHCMNCGECDTLAIVLTILEGLA